MTLLIRLALAVTALALLAPTRGLAADIKLRGIAIDQRLDAAPLPADLPRIVPTIVRLSIDDTSFTGPLADATLTRLQAAIRLYQSRQMAVVLAHGRADGCEWWPSVTSSAMAAYASGTELRRVPALAPNCRHLACAA